MMMIDGKKTKVGALLEITAAVVVLFYPLAGISLFMLGAALTDYGIYDRGGKNHAELKKRIKKPMLRSGHP